MEKATSSILKIVFVAFFMLLLSAGQTKAAATTDATLTLTPSSPTVALGSNFDLTVRVDPGSNTTNGVIGVQANLNFDPAVLQYVSAAPVSPFNQLTPVFNNTNGTVDIALYYPGNHVTTTSDVVRITFHAIAPSGSSAVNFDAIGNSSTEVTTDDGNGTYILGSTTGAVVTVSGAFDTTAPSISAFTLPSTSSSLTIPVSTFTATDNTGVTAWMVKETATASAPSAPTAGDSGWVTAGISGTTSATISGNITASAQGTRYFWAYAKDAAGNVSSVSSSQQVIITLPINTYTIGGSLSGLDNGAQVTLQNNDVDDLVLTSNGSFTFTTPLADGAAYSVSISSRPNNQECVGYNTVGNLSAANVTNMSIVCTDVVQQTDGTGISIPKPKATVNDNGRSLSSYFMDDKKIKLHSTITGLAGGKVRVTKDGKLIASSKIDSKGKWSVKIGFSKTSTVKVYYYDSTGTEQASKKYDIKIDSESPKFTDLPLILHKKAGDQIWWTATDNKGIDHYKYQIDGKTKATRQAHFNLSTTVSRGAHTINITAVDKAGNDTVKQIVVWVW